MYSKALKITMEHMLTYPNKKSINLLFSNSLANAHSLAVGEGHRSVRVNWPVRSAFAPTFGKKLVGSLKIFIHATNHAVHYHRDGLRV